MQQAMVITCAYRGLLTLKQQKYQQRCFNNHRSAPDADSLTAEHCVSCSCTIGQLFVLLHGSPLLFRGCLVRMCPCDVLLQVLHCRRLHASAPASAVRAAKGLHSMVTLQLDSYSTDRALLSSTTLSFVELAAQEPKVGRSSSGQLAQVAQTCTAGTTAACRKPMC
jgi:hypothetical protein